MKTEPIGKITKKLKEFQDEIHNGKIDLCGHGYKVGMPDSWIKNCVKMYDECVPSTLTQDPHLVLDWCSSSISFIYQLETAFMTLEIFMNVDKNDSAQYNFREALFSMKGVQWNEHKEITVDLLKPLHWEMISYKIALNNVWEHEDRLFDEYEYDQENFQYLLEDSLV